MDKREKTVLSLLKPKVKAFGFNKKELQSLAAKIAENLKSEENASDEDVNAEIEDAIEAVLPMLALGQAYANRVINDAKGAKGDTDDDDTDDNKPSKPQSKTQKSNIPEWADAIIKSNEALRSELSALKGEKLTDRRKAKLEAMLKDTGTFGTRTLKNFAKMKFDNDEEFDEFCTEIEEDLKSFNQERANAGLASLGSPVQTTPPAKKDKPEVLSDDDIKAIAGV